MSTQTGSYRVALKALAAAGGVLSVKNPAGVDLIVTRLVVDVQTAAPAVATVDGGIAANGTTLSDNLIDGLDVNAATGVFDNVGSGGVNGKAVAKWGASQYLTISQASGAVTGLAGYAHIEFIYA